MYLTMVLLLHVFDYFLRLYAMNYVEGYGLRNNRMRHEDWMKTWVRETQT